MLILDLDLNKRLQDLILLFIHFFLFPIIAVTPLGSVCVCALIREYRTPAARVCTSFFAAGVLRCVLRVT